jgi:hypothetical protein
MLISILIISIAFGILLKETDYLRIRLYVGSICADGDCCQWHFKDEWVTPDMKHELLRLWTNLPKQTLARMESGIQDPLCGWGYAWQYHDFIPECKVEMNLANVRYKMDIKAPGIIEQVMKVNRLTKQRKLEAWAKC